MVPTYILSLSATIHLAILAPPHVAELQPPPLPLVYSKKLQPDITTVSKTRISADKPADAWRIALLGDGGVGKTALAVQVRFFSLRVRLILNCISHKFTSDSFVGKSKWIITSSSSLI